MAAPARPIDSENFKTMLSKLYRTDAKTRELLDGFEITAEMLKKKEFDIKNYLRNKNLQFALLKAMESDDGRELVARAGAINSSSPELEILLQNLLSRFGDPRIEVFLATLPE